MFVIILNFFDYFSKTPMNVVCRYCLRPTLSLNFSQATAVAHILNGRQGN
jgi:hypothetical protein